MGKHEWREQTDDGETRLFLATRRASQWTFQARLKTEEEWTVLDPCPLDDLVYLHEILFNKYQRRRVPAEQVAEIETMIRERDGGSSY